MTARMRPNLFLVGAPKCGTTALHSYLAQHPDVYCSPLVKEFNHFNQDLTGGTSGVASREQYLAFFDQASGRRYAVDGSVWYLYSEIAAAEIRRFEPDARIVIALRDPVEQVASMHSQRLATGNEDIPTLSEALDAEADRRAGRRLPEAAHVPSGLLYREVARYSRQVQRFLETFPREQVHVMLYEDFRADPEREYRRLLEFLQVAPVMPSSFEVVNPNKAPRVRALPRLMRRVRQIPVLRAVARAMLPSQALRIRMGQGVTRLNHRHEQREAIPPRIAASLRAEFAADVARLEQMLGRKLPWPANDGVSK